MTNEEFRECLDRYGSDLERWPDGQRGVGRAFADTVPGRRELDAARAFDALLAETSSVPEPLGLRERILANVRSEGRPMDLVSWLFAPLWRPAALAVAPLALGFTVGFTYPETDSLEEAVAVIAFTEIEEAVDPDSDGEF
ncbi:MAG: hypothetical protein OXP28_17495 [Gammaproteobacteria bacterium]|nr:hypothetical protein [Gammaproteobacteria bacterium]MDE0226908.1 hypothetical protein [Gammaproteobacteria bacterium]MDE0452612.1 hypothetical protein [Gammaproteobacteria bacterium]